MSTERKPTLRNLRREQEWKNNLPQPVIDFFDGKNNETSLSDEEEQEIQRQQEVLRKLSEAFYEGLDASNALNNESKKKGENQDIHIKTRLLPVDKWEERVATFWFAMQFSGLLIGGAFWVFVRVLLSFTFVHPNRLTDILSFFPTILISKENIKNWLAGERTYSWFSVCDPQKKEERRMPLYERQKLNPPVPRELYAGTAPMFFFGKSGQHYVGRRENGEGHIVCFGGSGLGKSSCIAIPSLYTWDGALLAIDVKGELSENAPYRHNNYVLDPFDPSSDGYDPFEVLDNYADDDIVHGIQDIVYAILPGNPKSDINNDYWTNNARSYLSGMYLWAYRRNMSFTEINEKICSMTARELLKEVAIAHDLPVVMRFLGGYVDMNDKTLDCIVSTAKTAVELYAVDGSIQNVMNRKKTIHPGMLLDGGRIFIKIPEQMIDPWRTFLNMIVNQFLRECAKFPDKGGQRILFLIDEFARLGRIRSIEDSMTTLRSKGVTICLLTQSISQIDAIYGLEHRRIIMDNAAYTLVLSARDPASAEEISKMIGKDWFTKTSVSTKRMAENNYTYNKQLLYIVPPEKLSNLGNEMIVISKDGFCRVEKVNIFKDSFPWKGK